MSITPYVPPSTLTNLPSGIWSGTQGLPVFPYLPGQTPVVTKTPTWSTIVNRSASGRERRTQEWPYPLWTFELSYEVIRHEASTPELFVMWEFFNVMQGMYAPFLFVDPTDCQILSSAPATFGTGDGVTTTFQLQRQINSFSEPVYDVYAPTILNAGTPTVAYTIAPNGVLTFTTAPANGHALQLYGYFYYGCRFLDDTMSFERMMSYLWDGKKVAFTSLRA